MSSQLKLLMVCKGEYYSFMPAIASALKSRYGHKVSAMTFATPTAQLRTMQVFDAVYNLAAYLKREVPHYDLDECINYLQRLELAEVLETVNVMAYADRIIRSYSFERVLTILTGVCRFWEKLFHEAQPDVVVGEVACASEWIAWSLAKAQGIHYLIPYSGPIPRRFFFVRSPVGGWDSTELLYREAKERGLSAEQTLLAEDFLSTFRVRKMRSPIHAPAFRSPVTLDRTAWDRLVQRIKRVPFRVRTHLEDSYFEVGSYNGTAPWEGALKDLLRMARHLVGEAVIFDTDALPGQKVYFPLHVQPEFNIDVRAPFCTNQLALIESIAKSIPVGYRLVVKDHPGMRGYRPMSYYRQLKRLYNVQLLSPAIDSHSIIQNSEVVLTIVGTTAWEGILYERPVVAFGPLAYRSFDLLYNCPNASDLPSVLAEAIRGFRPNHNLLLKFIWATLESAHHGEWHDPLATPSVLDPDNVEKIAGAIISEANVRYASEPASMPI
jgi:hypothetical protein